MQAAFLQRRQEIFGCPWRAASSKSKRSWTKVFFSVKSWLQNPFVDIMIRALCQPWIISKWQHLRVKCISFWFKESNEREGYILSGFNYEYSITFWRHFCTTQQQDGHPADNGTRIVRQHPAPNELKGSLWHTIYAYIYCIVLSK